MGDYMVDWTLDIGYLLHVIDLLAKLYCRHVLKEISAGRGNV